MTILDAKTYKSLFEHMLNGVVCCQVQFDGDEVQDFVYIYTNPAFYDQTGLRNLAGRPVTEVIPGIRESDPILFETYARVAKTRIAEKFEIYVASLSNWFAVSVYSPQPGHIVAVSDVITSRKEADKKLAESEMFFKESQRAAFIGSYLLDFATGQWKSSEVLDQIFGIDQRYGRSVQGWLNLIHPDDVEMMDQHLRDDVIAKQQPFRHEYRIVRQTDREIRWVAGRGEVRFDRLENLLSLTGTIMDITERKELEQRLERLAHTDFLTGLGNRGHFLEMAGRELARVRRYRTPMSIAMLDLDHFKLVNDTYGHEIGDKVLRQFADICRHSLRQIDVMGRLGGEEFAIIFPETTGDQAFEVCERLREAVAMADIPMERGLPIRISVSLGLATFVTSDVNIDVFLNRADQALYEAKRRGRNRTCEALSTDGISGSIPLF